jgi:hypothetical protein
VHRLKALKDIMPKASHETGNDLHHADRLGPSGVFDQTPHAGLVAAKVTEMDMA